MSYAYDESPGFDDDSLFASGRAQHSFNGSHPSPAHNPHNRNRSHDRERMILDPDEDPNTPNQAHHRGARPGHPGGHVGSSYSISSAHSSHSRQHSALLSGSSSVPSPDRLSLAQQGHHSRGNGINSISSSSGGGGAISSSMNHSSMNHSSGSASSSLMDLDEEDERLYRPHPKQLLDRDEEALYARVQPPQQLKQQQQHQQQQQLQKQQHPHSSSRQHRMDPQQHPQLQPQPQPQSHNLSKHQSSSRVRPPPRSSVARAAAVSDDFAGDDDDDEDEDPYASNGDTQRSDGVDADQAVQEEEGAQPLFVAELESSATLLTMLTCLPTLGRDKSKQHLTLTLIEEGIKISVAQAGSIYCRAYIKNSCFTTYKLLRKDVKLSLVQTQLLQCLQIFGQPARVSLTYRAEGAPLELSLHLGGIITKCAVYTLDREADIIDEVVPRRRAGEGDSEFSSSKNSSNRSSSSSIGGRRGDKHNSHGNHANNSNAGDTAGKGGKHRIAGGGGGGDSVGFSANPRSRMVSHPPPRSPAAASPNSGSGMESDDSASPSLSSSVSISALSPSAHASSSLSSSKSSKSSKSAANSSSSSKSANSSSSSKSASSRSHNNNNPDNPQWLFDMHRTVARATMRSAVLKDALAELDVNGVEALRFQWTHRAPFLSMRCLGDSVKCVVEFPRDGDRRQEVFSEFECEPELVRSEYSMHLIRACARSLAKSNEAYLRVNEIGMLSLQQMITQDQPVGNWLDIAIMPQAEHRDLPAEGEAEL